MKSKHISIIAFFLFLCAMQAFPQMQLPTKMVGNTNFYYYKVGAKETLFGIAKKLNISKDDILKYNPFIAAGLKEKDTLFFPYDIFSKVAKKENVEVASTNVKQEKSFTHIVEKGETLYGIAKTYNVTQEAVIAQNPATAKGLKTGQVLIIPQPSQITLASAAKLREKTANVAINTPEEIVYHTIKKGETLYSVSKFYSTSIDKILALNPGISPTNFKLNGVIKVMPNTAQPIIKEQDVTMVLPYEVKKNDTFVSVARDNGAELSQIIEANQGVKGLKKGQIINIPVKRKEKVMINAVDDTTLQNNFSLKIKQIYDSVHGKTDDNEINVALLLPYMLQSAKASKAARLYTEFYKGFLMAVDKIIKQEDTKINVSTFDTRNSLKVLDSILAMPKMKQMDMIFAPDESDQIDALSRFGKKNNVNIVNTFSLKNEDYNSNSHIFQVNIPHSFMFAEVIDWFDENFKGYDVVFLRRSNSEVKDFAAELKKHFVNNKDYKTHNLIYGKTLSYDQIDKLIEPGKKYIFIPTTSSRSTIFSIAPVLKRIKSDRIDADMALFGYPEWGTYLSDFRDDFHTLDTYIYTRFFIDPTSSDVKDFESKYRHWYGEDMIFAAPKFGLLGYDVGMYFLSSMQANKKDFNDGGALYGGLQNDFKFERLSNWSGFVNKSVYFVHFTTFNTIEKTTR